MTVAVSCNLSEGVILGVDSAITVATPQGILKVYEQAEKMFQLGAKPIGIGVFGLSSLGFRAIGSYVREFELANKEFIAGAVQVEAVVERLREFFVDVYDREVVPVLERETKTKFDQIPQEKIPVFGLVIGGFSDGAFLSEVWQILVPINKNKNSATRLRNQGDFGTNWFATFAPIQRYVLGYDVDLLNGILSYFHQLLGRDLVPDEIQNVQAILGQHEYSIPFAAMPVKEGIEHVRFLVELVINHHRYAVGAPVVGGEACIGLVTYKGEKFTILN